MNEVEDSSWRPGTIAILLRRQTRRSSSLGARSTHASRSRRRRPTQTPERFAPQGSFASPGALDASSGHLGIGSRPRADERDPLLGFRLDIMYGVGAASSLGIVTFDEELRAESYVHDPVVQRVVRDAGRHRIYHDPDPRRARDRAGTLDEKYWTLLDLTDRLKLVYALSPDVELHFAIDRHGRAPRFTKRDVAVLDLVMRGLDPVGASRRALARLPGRSQAAVGARARDDLRAPRPRPARDDRRRPGPQRGPLEGARPRRLQEARRQRPDRPRQRVVERRRG
ncbi:MAG: hypothetical protein KF850_21550 [Labilithrix sp.]|nr:hypothetical protein [Labilithrix sp.]